jgi:hypothetical protein
MTVRVTLGTAEVELAGNMRIFAGRDADVCPLSFAHPTLSRRHAEIWLADGTPHIRDLGSANGTWIDGKTLGGEGTALAPGNEVWLGHVQLCITWDSGRSMVMAAHVPDAIVERIERRSRMIARVSTPPAAPLPADYAYRTQGKAGSGLLLLALRQDAFWSGNAIEGFVEYSALDDQTVACITVELVEAGRHVWDRVLVKQGPWRAARGDVLPLPFALRVAPGIAATSAWEIRSLVDINWAIDVDATLAVTLRNPDLERIRDAMGALDFRIVTLEPEPGKQRFAGTFVRHGAHCELSLEYLGANVKIRVDDGRRAYEQVFELARIRNASQPEVTVTLEHLLTALR